MIPFDVREYMAHALRMKPSEELLRQEMEEWLPEEIIDAHAHCNLEGHVNFINDRALGHMLSTFPYFSIADSQELRALFLPGCQVRSLRFAKTFRGIDHRAANEYLLVESPSQDRIAIFGLPEDIDYTVGIMRHPRASALKMYWSYLEPPAQRIYEFFPEKVLEEAQALGMPIVLHLPRMIVHSCEDLLQVIADFPRLKVSLAHLGLSKMPTIGLEEAYRGVARSENVVMDTALNPSSDVVSLALQCFGQDRILFGSDEPLNLIRSVAYLHPQRGQRIVADYPYHWFDPEEYREYGHLATEAVHAHWQCLQAIQGAIEREPSKAQHALKEKIFAGNANAFFEF